MTIISLNRFREDGYGTIGNIAANGKSLYILERAKDGPHCRIPAATYELGLKPIGSSHFDDGSIPNDDVRAFMGPLHRGMIEVLNVPGRTEILIHPGNSVRDIEGCLAPGMSYSVSSVMPGKGSLSYWLNSSRPAYKILYPIISDMILGDSGAQLRISETFQPEALIA